MKREILLKLRKICGQGEGVSTEIDWRKRKVTLLIWKFGE